MEVHCPCSSAIFRSDYNHFNTSIPALNVDIPAGCKQTRCWFQEPALSCSCSSRPIIPSCNTRRFVLSCLKRAGLSHFHRDAAALHNDTEYPFCVSFGRFGGLVRQRFLFRSINQHLEGSSSYLNQDDSEQADGENGTVSSTSSSFLSPSVLPAPDAFSEISDESFNETKRLVETAMLAAAAGLAYFLSNTFRIENYFGCFFPLPLVISSLRWGVAAGRKTMVATGMLLLVLSGPLKAATYLLMHGFLGLTMGALWRSKMSWGSSLIICTLVRSIGAMGFVFLTSWLIRENLLVLITINAHASISLLLATMGINFVPSMGNIYFIFGTLVLLNCGSFVLILHLLYAIFLKRMELKSSLIFPTWLKAL
ncbi:hypothetical protein L7F22_061630 [Adiantum nelumboides]|nr:hypothetical protein [Adiantum nelumboides]